MPNENGDGQLVLDFFVGRTSPEPSPAAILKGRTSASCWRKSSELKFTTLMCLDLRPGGGNLLGPCWEYDPPWLGAYWTLNTGASPRDAAASSLSQILEASPHPRYYLSRRACLGILRRAEERGKALPPQLKAALLLQSGLVPGKGRPQPVQAMAFAANQRDEARNLHDISATLAAQPGMKQQTFITQCLTPFAAGFCAGAAPTARGIGYQEEVSPTLKAGDSGTNMVPSIFCLNDQGGKAMDCSEEVSGALRAQEHGHQPLVFENHAIDARYTGPHTVVPTMTARYGTGGNNQPLIAQKPVDDMCIAITGNIVDRAPKNGGNGLGFHPDVSYTLTGTDRHAVFRFRRTDRYQEDDTVSAQSARQYKAATDLVIEAAGLDCRNARENGDLCGTLQRGTAGSSLNSIHPVRIGCLIRRLTPLECERLQGYPDGWTDTADASDSARYKALGNSVAVPCVAYIMRGIVMAQGQKEEKEI